jgi:hypothetical protein
MATIIDEEILSKYRSDTEEAALLGVPTRTTYEWRKIGFGPPWLRLPHGKVGRILYYKTSTAEWMAEQGWQANAGRGVA